jgi:cyclopropane-fatty-acyl-phospholipid synthase
MTSTTEGWGGSAAAIQHHYDVGNDFYALWLDETLSYSCALWEGPDDTSDLATAQRRKIDYHIRQSGAAGAKAVLDVGCGWGAVLRRLVEGQGVERAVGLTLSNAQAEHIQAHKLPGVEIRTESWVQHQPRTPYDAIISIGAFEHFAPPSYPVDQKIEVYRDFLRKCRSWLTRKGQLSLQTIAYGTLRPEEASAFMQQQIFPDSELPRLGEIVAAADGLFEIVSLRNDRLDYARTCEQWLRRLRDRRQEALALVGEEGVARYERYLKLSSVGFHMGKICLLRLTLKPIAEAWGSGRGA